MRKTHWFENDRSKCRPKSLDRLRRDAAETIPQVTCSPCLKALGLTSVVMRTVAKETQCVLRLPNGKKSKAFTGEFVMEVINSPVAEWDASRMLNTQNEPPKVVLEIRLTEFGLSAIKELLLKSV